MEFPKFFFLPLFDRVKELKLDEYPEEETEFNKELESRPIDFHSNMKDMADSLAKKYYPDMCRRYIACEKRIKHLEKILWKLPREDKSMEEDRFEILGELLDKACKGFDIWEDNVLRKLKFGHRLVLEDKLVNLINSKFDIIEKTCSEFDKLKGDKLGVKKEREDIWEHINDCNKRFNTIKCEFMILKEVEEKTLKQSTIPKVVSNEATATGKWIQRTLDMGVNKLQEEHSALARYTLPERTYDSFEANNDAGKNRYQDVPCQDQSRVVLNWPEAPSNYIHANYVSSPRGVKRFICTQGPLDTTVNDFWMMILQENSETIVMLCNCIEKGKNKCAQYWPNTVGEVRNLGCGGIEITHKESRPMSVEEPTVILTILSVKFDKPGGGQETREIHHYQWTDWPDQGVPPCKMTSMELLSRVRGTQKPIVVHCSAGIGRTGSIVAIQLIMEKLEAGIECEEMGELLKELRNQRAYSIQNEVQYLFVHRVMLNYFLEKQKARYEAILTAENQAKYKKFIEEYNATTGQK